MFDPIPTTDTVITVNIDSRAYRIVRAIKLDAGDLNIAFAGISIVGKLFGKSMTFKRIRSEYQPTTDKTVKIVEATVTTDEAPPPVPYSVGEVDGVTILSHDMRLIIPSEVFSDTNSAAYDLQLRG